MLSVLNALNPEQRAAVTLPNEHALILAGAGSGKTRVLTTRIAWLISQQRVSPAGVLAVTFTNKAAREMQTRLSSILPIDVRMMWIGTFHGLCNRMLHLHHQEVGLSRQFQILDSSDQLSAIKRLMKANNISTEKYPPKHVQYFINQAKEQGLRPHEVAVDDQFNRVFVELYEAYQTQCQREDVVDFAELLLRCYELLNRNQVLREHYQMRFQHVLVDEFQDTNKLQFAWLKLLIGQNNSIFAVGDDDQSIYGFRGADVGNMWRFEKEYQVKHLIKLEQNYRSHGHILDAANGLIKNNQRRLGKDLRTEAGEGERIRVYEALSDNDEAGWIVDEIQRYHQQGYLRRDMAILYRSNAQSRVIEHTLVKAGLPYRVYGGMRFFDRQEIKHALAYLRLIYHPNDDTAFLRVVNFPTRGIGARTLEQLVEKASFHQCSLMSAVAYVEGKSGSSLLQFVRLIAQIRDAVQTLNLPNMVEYVIEHSGLIAHYQKEKEGLDRLENLQELINAASTFVLEEGYDLKLAAQEDVAVIDANAANEGETELERLSALSAFLSHTSLESGESQAGLGDDAVQLMTVHAAKGLEFDIVFISGLEEGLFPHENSLLEEQGLEEERRLMYVAITRAKQHLNLSFAQSRMLHGQVRYHLKSRFFDELPEKTLQWLLKQKETSANWGGKTYLNDATQHSATSSKASRQTPKPHLSIKVGQQVFHHKFGEGQVMQVEGDMDEDAKVQVNFKRHGTKWLVLSIAKLQVIQ